MDSVIEYVTVPFMGFDVLAIALDGIPVKNHLPAPLAAALKTAKQLITNLEESTGHGGLRSYGYPAF